VPLNEGDELVTEYNDMRCGDDLDPFGRDAAPLEVLGQDLYHFLITVPGALILDPNWGLGLELYLGQDVPSTLAADIENAVRQEFDGRISDAACTVERLPSPDDEKSYRVELKAEVDENFLLVALNLTPDGIVRVS
jgi:phage baseplate assembly protein W